MTYLSDGSMGCCGLGGVGGVLPIPAPVPGRPQTPIFPFRFNQNGGGFGFVRHNIAEGGCVNQQYPCTHPGIDVAGVAGTVVVAPEDSVVVRAADGTSSPFTGYGPWVLVLAGASGKFHLLAHLDPANRFDAPIGKQLRAGDRVGTVAVDHTHWEVRTKPVPAPGEGNMPNNTDPLNWLTLARLLSGTGPLIVLGAAGLLGLVWLYRRRR